MDTEGNQEHFIEIAETESTLRGSSIGIQYVPGKGSEVVQFTRKGIKIDFSGKKYVQLEYLKDKRRVRGGYGSYVYEQPTHYILTVEIDGQTHEIWTESDFRTALGIKALTQAIRKQIEDTLPEEVQVVLRVGQKGTKYYRLAPQSIKDWADKIKESANPN